MKNVDRCTLVGFMSMRCLSKRRRIKYLQVFLGLVFWMYELSGGASLVIVELSLVPNVENVSI